MNRRLGGTPEKVWILEKRKIFCVMSGFEP
jgi:hypothetical protein